jgi:hypothetical protein
MGEQLGTIIERVIDRTDRPEPHRQPGPGFWRDLNDELKAAQTPEEAEAVWARYAAERSDTTPNRRQRRGSTLDPVKFRPLNREQRARLIFLAERLDANTREARKHGGCLKRTGLQVLRILLFHFHNVASGRCDPSLETIAKAAGMARSTVVKALSRLEAVGISSSGSAGRAGFGRTGASAVCSDMRIESWAPAGGKTVRGRRCAKSQFFWTGA